MMTPPASNGRPNSRFSATAPPITSAMSVAPATISAWAQYRRRRLVPRRFPRISGRLMPVARPSFADWYCTSTAMALAMTSTHTSR